jgi:phospholipase C
MPGPAEWNRDVEPPADAEAEAQRAACGYAAGALPAETQGESRPTGRDVPIDHVIVVMMENRSFDHYFQKLPEHGQPDVEVAPEGFTNPDLEGKPVAPFHDDQYCFVDTNHGWDGVHQQIGGGKMDGFFASNDGHHELPAHGTLDMLSGRRAMAYYDGDDLPFYYWLASEFSIADHYHSSVPGPTWPNRMYLYAATSFGLTSNTLVSPDKTLFDYLELRGVDWKVYADGTPGMGVFPDQFIRYREARVTTLEQYFEDAASGRLPGVAFVDPNVGLSDYPRNDDHPPTVHQVGQRFVADVVDALTKSPAWSRSALFLTYDEHGGLYDHVVPPAACPPDDHAPDIAPGGAEGGFEELGIRVPMIVVSPFAKRHHVSHRTMDHTSIVRFIEARFVIPALTGRDANAEAPWDMFDFEAAPHADPPSVELPDVDPAKLDACKAIFEP